MRSKRENYLILGTVGVIGAVILWLYVVEPYFDSMALLRTQLANAQKDVDSNQLLFRQEDRARRTWKEMSDAGITDQPPQAERKLLHALRGWAQEAGVNNLSLRPERTNRPFGYVKVIIRAGGNASEASIAKLLWSIESTSLMPLRVDDVTLTPLKEGNDDLTMALTVSILCVATDADKGATPPTKSAKPSTVTPSGASNLVEDRT